MANYRNQKIEKSIALSVLLILNSYSISSQSVSSVEARRVVEEFVTILRNLGDGNQGLFDTNCKIEDDLDMDNRREHAAGTKKSPPYKSADQYLSLIHLNYKQITIRALTVLKITHESTATRVKYSYIFSGLYNDGQYVTEKKDMKEMVIAKSGFSPKILKISYFIDQPSNDPFDRPNPGANDTFYRPLRNPPSLKIDRMISATASKRSLNVNYHVPASNRLLVGLGLSFFRYPNSIYPIKQKRVRQENSYFGYVGYEDKTIDDLLNDFSPFDPFPESYHLMPTNPVDEYQALGVGLAFKADFLLTSFLSLSLTGSFDFSGKNLVYRADRSYYIYGRFNSWEEDFVDLNRGDYFAVKNGTTITAYLRPGISLFMGPVYLHYEQFLKNREDVKNAFGLGIAF